MRGTHLNGSRGFEATAENAEFAEGRRVLRASAAPRARLTGPLRPAVLAPTRNARYARAIPSGGSTMLDHITFGVTDFARSTAFYTRAFAPLGREAALRCAAGIFRRRALAGYGDNRPWFWLAEQDATRGKLHIALTREVARRSSMRSTPRRIAAGGRDNGAPGLAPALSSELLRRLRPRPRRPQHRSRVPSAGGVRGPTGEGVTLFYGY